MFNFIKKYYIFILVILTVVFAIVTIIYSRFFPTKTLPQAPQQPIPTYSPQASSSINPAQKPVGGQQYQVITPSGQEQLNKDALVSHMIKNLPFQGQNFSLTYDYSSYTFYLTLKQGHESEGNKEFDNFLKQNNIQDRSWLNNLVTKTQ